MSGSVDGELVPGLPANVIDRLRAELGDAERIIRCLRTAAVLIEQAETDDRDLRFAASAAYNLREALDSVVRGKDAAEGGLAAVMEAWQRYKAELDQPNADTAAAQAALTEVMDNVEADLSRASSAARRLLTYLRDRAGVDHRGRQSDPIAEYAELRVQANRALHSEFALGDTTALFTRTVSWFVRLFAPPDEMVDAIRRLAAQPWQGDHQIAELGRLAMNDHHLRLFFGEITDPAWLEPLHDAGFAELPVPDRPWPPVASLVSGLGLTDPHSVADLLIRMLADTRQLGKDERAYPALQLLIVAVQLGQAGDDVVVAVAKQHGDQPTIRLMSVHVAQRADPAAPVMLEVADAVLNHFERFADGDHYNASTVLDQLQAGIAADNVAERARMLAAKIRNRTASPADQYVDLGAPALTRPPDDLPEPQLLLAHHMAQVLSKARQFGIPTVTQLDWLGTMSGEVGDRLRSHALAGADDVSLTDKIDHIASRLASHRATGDDLALVADIRSRNPQPDELAVWNRALGTPSPAPTGGEDRIPLDWARTWSWAAVLPDEVFAGWREPLAHLSSRWGQPDQSELNGDRTPLIHFAFGSSPYTAGQLAAMPVPDAAALVAAWRPDAATDRALIGPPELARALETTVSNDPAAWCADPAAVVTTLREPIYLEYYFRALSRKAADIAPYATTVLDAAAQARAVIANDDQQETGLDETESDPSSTETAILDLIGTLANNNADIAPHLDELWDWALAAVDDTPHVDEGLLFAKLGPLESAMNRRWGRGLRTVIALAAWEFRNRAAVRPSFAQALDTVSQAQGSVGREFRAVLAHLRPVLEQIGQPWLDNHANALFREGALGQETFDLTIKWAVATPWLYENLKAELIDAARRGAKQATRQIMVAVLNEVDGYDHDTVIGQLRADSAILASASEDAAFLAQRAEPNSPRMTVAIRFWTRLLDSDRTTVPAEALHRLGRWAFVTNLNDQDWADLTARTLTITGGRINHTTSVADRAAAITPSPTSRTILLEMLDRGEPWERHHVADLAIDVLRRSASSPADDSFWRLRTRLMDLGHHQARDILPDEKADET